MNEDLKNALREGTLYDFVSNEGYRLDRDDLITLIKELSFATYELEGESFERQVQLRALENIEENEID